MKQIFKCILFICFCVFGLSVFSSSLGAVPVGVDPANLPPPVDIPQVTIGGDNVIKDNQGAPVGGMDALESIVGRVAGYLFLVGVFLAPLLIIIGGYMYLTSAGDSNKTQSAKKLIYWSIGGLAVLLFARGIISIFRYILNF